MLESDKETLRQAIAVKPEWTENQTQERSALTDAIGKRHSEIEVINNRLVDLRNKTEAEKRAVEAFVKHRGMLNSQLDTLQHDIDNYIIPN